MAFGAHDVARHLKLLAGTHVEILQGNVQRQRDGCHLGRTPRTSAGAAEASAKERAEHVLDHIFVCVVSFVLWMLHDKQQEEEKREWPRTHTDHRCGVPRRRHRRRHRTCRTSNVVLDQIAHRRRG